MTVNSETSEPEARKPRRKKPGPKPKVPRRIRNPQNQGDAFANHLPFIGQWVVSTKRKSALRFGRIVAVFAAKEEWKRLIRPPTLIVQWKPGRLRIERRTLRKRRGRRGSDLGAGRFNAGFRTLRHLRPATEAEAAETSRAWAEAESAMRVAEALKPPKPKVPRPWLRPFTKKPQEKDMP